MLHASSRAVVAVFLLAASMAVAGEAAPPPDAADVVHLDDTVVVASRHGASAFEEPYSTDVFDFDYVHRRKLPRTVPEVFADDPTVMVQKTGHGQGSPFIRGFTGFRTLLLIDGIRLNNSTFRDGPNQYWNTVDTWSIGRFEIVRGPASVLYGSDAVGGTVNAIPRGRETFPDGFNWSRRIVTRFSSAERSAIARLELEGNVGQRLGFMLGTTFKDFGDLEGGRDVGRQHKTGYDERDCDLRLEYRLSENASLIFGHQRVTIDDAWRTHKTRYGIAWHGTTVGDEKRRDLDQARELTYLRYRADGLDGFVQSIETTLSYHVQEEDRFRIRRDDRSDRQGVTVRTLGLATQLTSQSPVGLLTYGIEYYRDSVDSFKKSHNADGSFAGFDIQGPVADVATYDLLGIYIQDEFPILPRLDATVGLRYTYARADADRVKDPDTGDRISLRDSWDNVVGSARLAYRASDHWNLFAGCAQGFRAPNLSDLTRLDSARSGEVETPSPGLDPETFCSLEIGAKARYERWSTRLAWFYTRIRDMIVRYPTGRTIDGDAEVQKANVGDGFVTGIEARADYGLTRAVTLFAALAWQWGEVDTFPTSAQVKDREPMSRIPPLTALVGARWQPPGKRYWVETVVRMADDQTHLSTRDKADTQRIPPGGTPGYGVWDIRAGIALTERLAISGSIENILDKDYRVHGSGINEPGRNVILSADWAF